MSKYSCERCGKEFSQKSHYDSHKRRKKPCENYSNKIQTMLDKKVKEVINDLNFLNLKKLILKMKEMINQKYNKKYAKIFMRKMWKRICSKISL